jgi:predicted PurR-regulated permease PerM
VLGLLAVLWRLLDVLLLVFASSLLALALVKVSQPLRRFFAGSSRLALAVTLVGALLLIGGGMWLAGASAVEQMQVLRKTLPQSVQALEGWLGGSVWGSWILQLWNDLQSSLLEGSSVVGWATQTLSATGGAVGSMVLLVVIAIYLAADPVPYRRGFVAWVPPRRRALTEQTLDALEYRLSRWLLGQVVSMVSVGLLTAIVLSVIGMPLVLSLSLIAGLLEIIPYFGPVVSGALIVAMTKGDAMAWAALAACVVVQQLEAYVIQPGVQRWAVRLLPVWSLLAVLCFGLLFGLAGVLLASPLTVLVMTLMDELYVKAYLQPQASDFTQVQ